MRNHYCVCTYMDNERGYGRVYDSCTFSNPEKDPGSKKKCWERKVQLEEMGKIAVQAIEVIGINQEDVE